MAGGDSTDSDMVPSDNAILFVGGTRVNPINRLVYGGDSNNSCGGTLLFFSQVSDADSPVFRSGRHEAAVVAEGHTRHLQEEQNRSQKRHRKDNKKQKQVDTYWFCEFAPKHTKNM